MIIDYTVPIGGLKAKATVTATFSNEVFNLPEFQTPKGPSWQPQCAKARIYGAHAKKSGCSWSLEDSLGRVSDVCTRTVYDDVELPFLPDAKVAEKINLHRWTM